MLYYDNIFIKKLFGCMQIKQYNLSLKIIRVKITIKILLLTLKVGFN